MIGDGQTIQWNAGGAPVGTYDIVDPATDSTSLVPFYDNSYTGAYLAKWSRKSSGARAVAAEDTVPGNRFAIAATGPVRLTLVDETGRSVHFDDATDGYVSDLPGAIAVQSSGDQAPGASVSRSPGMDLIIVSKPQSGTYMLSVVGSGAGLGCVTVQALADTGETYLASMERRFVEGQISRFRLRYSQTGSTVVGMDSVSEVSRGRLPRAFELRAVPTPAHGTVNLELMLRSSGRCEIDILDIQGRRVAVVSHDQLAGGPHRIVWDGKSDGGVAVGTGLYFARAVAGGETRTVRIVIVH